MSTETFAAFIIACIAGAVIIKIIENRDEKKKKEKDTDKE